MSLNTDADIDTFKFSFLISSLLLGLLELQSFIKTVIQTLLILIRYLQEVNNILHILCTCIMINKQVEIKYNILSSHDLINWPFAGMGGGAD